MWKAQGDRNHLQLSPEEEKKRRADAAEYRKLYRPTGDIPETEPTGDAEERKLWRAARFFLQYDSARSVTVFTHHYNRSLVEQLPQTVRARKLFYQAEALASTGSTFLALQKYQDPHALQAWATILENHPEFRAGLSHAGRNV